MNVGIVKREVVLVVKNYDLLKMKIPFVNLWIQFYWWWNPLHFRCYTADYGVVNFWILQLWWILIEVRNVKGV